jgi:hypothetical protein
MPIAPDEVDPTGFMRNGMLRVIILVMAAAAMACAESTLHIGFGAGTPCATGCGQDPNTEGLSDTVDIYFNNQSSTSLVNSVLMILGVPNADAPGLFSNDSIVSAQSFNPYAGSASGGSPLLWNYQGYQGSFTSSYKGSVYSFLGLPKVNNSESFTNWGNTYVEWNTQLGIDPVVPASSFGIYVFSLFTGNGSSPLQSGGLLNVIFSNSRTLPIGTYIVAYGENAAKKPFGTPFTEAGLQGATPEPLSLLLFGTFVIGLVLYQWYQLRARVRARDRARSSRF